MIKYFSEFCINLYKWLRPSNSKGLAHCAMLHGNTNNIMASSKQAVAVLASMFNVKVYDPKRWIMVFVINGIYQDTKYCP